MNKVGKIKLWLLWGGMNYDKEKAEPFHSALKYIESLEAQIESMRMTVKEAKAYVAKAKKAK